jgi:hypothetical protein
MQSPSLFRFAARTSLGYTTPALYRELDTELDL